MKIGGKRTIVDLFLENIRQVPDKPFIRFSGTDFCYRVMGEKTAHAAEVLASAGIPRRSRVAILISNRPAFVTAFLGILRCGATAVPLNTLYKPDEVRYALEHAHCQAIMTEDRLAETVREACERVGHGVSVLLADADDEGAFTIPDGPPSRDRPGTNVAATAADDLAGIFYTSGTTARPKGVMVSHENMIYSAEVTIKSLGLAKTDVPLLAFPLFHVNSLFYGILTAIVLQGAVGLVRGFSVSSYWQDAVDADASWTPGITGPLMSLLLNRESSEAERGHRMRFAVGGTFLSLGQVEAFSERFGVSLIPGWSMTETVSLGSLHPIDRPMPLQRVTGIGFPTLGQEIRLVRDDGSDAGVGEPGEIHYRSPGLFVGYLEDEQATRDAITEDGWFRTGDVACMDETGYLAFMDRKKEMIKTKGENVAAAEVERALNQHPGVLESAAIGVPDRDGAWGERIEAYVVRCSGSEVDDETLMKWVGQHLADFKVPRVIHFIAQLPKTPLGKIQRQKLR